MFRNKTATIALVSTIIIASAALMAIQLTINNSEKNPMKGDTSSTSTQIQA